MHKVSKQFIPNKVKMAKILIFLCLTAISSLDAFSPNRNNTARVIGGFDAPEGSFPYQVSLQLNNKQHCGGSILSKDYVLTAAHCIVRYDVKKMKAVVGITKLSDGGSKHAILEAHIHEDYGGPQDYEKNDIAVIKVEEITFSSKVAPIPLDSAEILDDVMCTASGWGYTSFPGISTNHLQHINLTTFSFERCKAIIFQATRQYIHEKEICTFTKVKEGVCHADSGGPLVRDVDGVRKQIGIASKVLPCAKGVPDIFVRISSYIDWVKKNCNNCI